MKKRIGTAPMINNAKLKKLLQDKEVELWETKRQLEIEAALEKVRSLTMVMKRSDDLSEIILTVYKELRQLDIALTRTLIWLFSENPDMFEVWVADTEADTTSFVMKQEVEHPYHKRMFDVWKKRKSKWVYINEGEGKKDLDDYLFTKTAAAAVPEEVKAGIRAVNRIVNSFSFHNFGCLQADGAEELSEDNFEIMYRFAKEFDLAYTRFLDLQKAEAQAREAQIEASLERVRSRTMAMQKTDELLEAAGLLYKELFNLGIPSLTSGYVLMDKDEKIGWNYDSNPEDGSIMPQSLGIPHTKTKVMRSITASWKKQKPCHVIELNPQETIDHQTFIAEHTPNFPYTAAELISFSPERLVLHTFNFKEGYLLMINGVRLATDQMDMMIRFTRAFEQTYTRFLDLKKAEEQTREAEIQLALERVRARAMAMHKSNELADVASVLFHQLQELDIPTLRRCLIGIVDEVSATLQNWYTSMKGDSSNKIITYPIRGNPIIEKKIKTWRKKKPFSIEVSGEELQSLLQYSIDHGFEYHAGEVPATYMIQNHAPFSYGYLEVATHTSISNEDFELLQRFANVFDQTYTRFLDLQKAEAQAREAEIQLALERVRARTMAMHKSVELRDVVAVLYEQMIPLGFATLGCELILCDEQYDQLQYWSATPDQAQLPQCYLIPRAIHPFFQQVWQAWEERTPRLVITLEGIDKKKFDKLIFEKTAFRNFPESAKKSIMAGKVDVFSIVTMKYGLLEAVDRIPLPENSFLILERFAKVFEQTYTRFLDLQKAEKQARKAQIEAALERIRSRTMAMHRSEEIADIVGKILEELGNLDIVLTRVLIWIFNKKEKYVDWWSANSELNNTAESYRLDFNQNPVFLTYLKAWEKKIPLLKYKLSGDVKISWEDYIFNNTGLAEMPVEVQNGMREEGTIYTTSAISSYGLMMAGSREPLSGENIDIIQRFGLVFQQSYTRYLDVQKAEAQAREAQIEASLERVRARSMAMHNSEELLDVAHQLYKELEILGVPQYMTGFVQVDKSGQKQKVWVTAPNGNRTDPFFLPLKGDSILKTRYKSWEKQDPVFCQRVSGNALKNHLSYVSKHYESAEAVEIGNQFPDTIIFYCGNFSEGYLHILSEVKWDKEQEFILQKFTKVFAMTYRRFQDLKNAEAQAREAQIEASLERIRAKAMAMHSSEDISEATTIVFSELEHLGIKTMRCGIGIMDNNWGMEAWTAASTEKKEEVIKIIGQFDMTKHPALRGVYEAWKNQQDYFSYNLFGKDAQKYYEYVNKRPDYSVPKSKSILEKHTLNVFNFAEGGLFAFTEEPLAKESISILQRFTSVFTLTYRRYLDLIQAETQTREAQIEAGLERVRASTMAMHKSEQLSETAMVLFDQFYQLGQVPDRISIAIFNPSKKCFEFRVTDQSGSQLSNSYNATIEESTTIHKIYKAWKNGEKSAVIQLTRHNLKKWIRFVKEEMKLHIDEKKIQDRRIHHASFFSHGFLMYTSNTFMEPEFINLLVRFANVFDQTYTRFLDLQKAEAQAREAQIEASLERIRARAMAMQKSDELREVVGLVSEELNISLENTICIIMNFDWKSKEIEWWSTGFNIDNLPESYKIPIRDTIKDHPLIRHYREALQRGISYKVYKLEGEIKRSWEKYVFEQSELTKIPLETQNWMRSYEGVISNEAFMSHGVLQVDGPEQLSDEKAEILKRFAKVVDLTYTRVEDLQQAEARAMEAVRQASLDRVRGVIASMRSKEDLNRITPLIWKELKALGVPFIRCGVFIMDLKNEIIQSYLSTPDGKTLGIFNLPFTSELIGELMVNSWQIGKIYRDHWTRKQFVDFMKRLNETGQLKDTSAYQGTVEPPEKLDLHFIPFKQGMLYVGNTEPLTKNELILVKSLAETFSIAYARYEDFRELELAKNQIEETLNELKATQSQLIHAEKMASLGELTAGIAHEIQNPLNFVNNFSDVSIDLIGELKDERNKKRKERDESLEMEILDDVIQNLEKINHHGLRASSIVKGMLEHSRTGSKEKQLVDINALADEYLRLAYHGLRAKNKSFNADFKTDFDESMPKIEVVPQDIGRVLLNLINNAFYAVDKKAKKDIGGYQPLVQLRTKKHDSFIEIYVKDNGQGIPEPILDKIFQPFFTTKPTGQGTGLGLSLSYDIIKTHGGELSVKTKEGEGSDFIIKLTTVV